MCLCCLLALRDIFAYTYGTTYLFVLKLPLNIKQTNRLSQTLSVLFLCRSFVFKIYCVFFC